MDIMLSSNFKNIILIYLFVSEVCEVTSSRIEKSLFESSDQWYYAIMWSKALSLIIYLKYKYNDVVIIIEIIIFVPVILQNRSN